MDCRLKGLGRRKEEQGFKKGGQTIFECGKTDVYSLIQKNTMMITKFTKLLEVRNTTPYMLSTKSVKNE